MNVFEAEIAKYERRVERIERNPSPTMMASNKLLYQSQLEDNRELLRWWREGKPFFTASGMAMPILTRIFRDFQPRGFVPTADRMGSKDAERAVEKVWIMGLA